MTSPLLAAAMLFLGSAELQTVPIGMPVFPEPPELNGANPVTHPNAILHNSGLKCLQSAIGTHWECLVKSSELDAVEAIATGAQATASSAGTAATAAQATASNAASAAASAQSSASAAQTAANAAQSASSTNATAIAALVTRVGVAEGLISTLQSQVAALNALPKRLCTSAVLTGLAIPLTGGLSSTQNVNLPGVPVGTTCDVAGSSRPPAGATGAPVVTTAGVVNVAFTGGGGLLSGVLAIPSGTYRICCDS